MCSLRRPSPREISSATRSWRLRDALVGEGGGDMDLGELETRVEPRYPRRLSEAGISRTEQPRPVVLDLFLSLENLPVLVPLPLGAQTSG